ncbi:MAG: hypothetical protein KC613_18125 [Myxococcales bacterium]|nr:hypothetical protein [Myxococcales bacterium]
MTNTSSSSAIQTVEALMLWHFRHEPFHNLRLLYGGERGAGVPGGTCSDKTLSFVSAGLQAGLDVRLHSGLIDGRDIHRLARVHIESRTYFADVGNGWPALRLYPADAEIAFRCYGMGFRTQISARRISVFHERFGVETLQLEIDIHGKPEAQIRADIDRRFSSGLVYPFSHSLRFSKIVDNRFLFLRGDRLEIHADEGSTCIDGVGGPATWATLKSHFGHDVAALRPPVDR